MSLWDLIKSWKTVEGKQYISHAIPRARTDVDYDEAPLMPYQSYFRVWLAQMYLTRSRNWFTDWHPAVHSSVSLGFGPRGEKTTFSRVAPAPQEVMGPGVLQNFRLSELMPYNGGAVEIDASLVALRGESTMSAALGMLASFAGLVAPPLDKSLAIARQVAEGINSLFESADGKVHLCLHDGYVSGGGGGGNDLRPGYIAVILATDRDLDRSRLCVAGDRLLYQANDGAPAPLTSHDHMLLRIEKRIERPDWRLPDIDELMNKAVDAFIKGKPDEGEAFRRAALATAVTSPDLAMHDRRRVAMAVKAHIDDFRDMFRGMTDDRQTAPGLDALMQDAISAEEAMNRPPITLSELLSE